ncbi:MAG TPA: NADH-quinone oxidoreductase subunit L [Chitinophagales bacterium]|nr:NADH-quinone oxidoreductase subunit L [Chitinophagales bacterium]
MPIQNLYLAIIALPLIGFFINALLGKKMSKNLVGILASLMVFVPFVIILSAFSDLVNGGEPIHFQLFNWFTVAHYSVDFGIQIDQLSVIMVMLITGVGFLIHVYSIAYMKEDENYSRYFSYLNLFIFFMLILVMSDNYLGMFIGWEGVGLASYLLIGFWFKNDEYNNAAKKAFIMNRVGDLGFLVGMFFLFYYTGSLEYSKVNEALQLGAMIPALAFATSILLFLGATGKSAQIPLFTWLPDAMAGPTPVSALIHAATMVTAGVYMVFRSNLLFSLAPQTLEIIAIVGAATALYAAAVGLAQNDIKKVLAYSTVSQLGLMFLALGVGAYSTALFHVLTHAFFKALLFLGSGSVIHAVGGDQDIRRMGGLKKYMPITFITFLIGSLAISGVPPFSGFFSKDEILAMAFQKNIALWAVGVGASMMTAFYMFRVVFLTFFGEFRGTEEQKNQLHESPALMNFPLIVLAILATLGGFIGIPHIFNAPHLLNEFLAPITIAVGVAPEHLSATTEYILIAIVIGGALISIGIAYVMYISKRNVPGKDASYTGVTKWANNKFYVDEFYDAIIVRPVQWTSDFLFKAVDKVLIDGVVNTTGRISLLTGDIVRSIQTGQTAFYILAMVLSVCFILGYFLIGIK